jgi:prophage regulatory protein
MDKAVMPALNHADRVVGDEECERNTGLARTTRHMLRREGKFPAPLRLSRNRVGWRLSDLAAWIESRERA